MGWVVSVVAGWIVLSPVVALVLSRSMRDRPRPAYVAPPPAPPVAATAPPALGDATVVVAAHGLANSCSVVIGGGETLRARWADMAPEQRDEILGMMVEQTKLVQQVLVDLTRGVADDLVHALDNLERPLSLPAPDADGAASRP